MPSYYETKIHVLELKTSKKQCLKQYLKQASAGIFLKVIETRLIFNKT